MNPTRHYKHRICVAGLGYVGLPLACLFASRYQTIGFDINQHRVRRLRAGIDETGDIEAEKLRRAIDENHLQLTSSADDIAGCNVYIVTVPTPVKADKSADLQPLAEASESIGSVLRKGDCVIYESTVYPGVTEDVCIPLLERASGLRLNEDFMVGYSPERVNPGDRLRTVEKVSKVVSGSSDKALKFVKELYDSVLQAPTHAVSSIKVAEAAKVIENSQRDLNIAFVNELAKIFHLLGIDTTEVLEAASTKWNFLPFRPGLVGGHCIGVDPYYLAQCAQSNGYNPEIILSGRRLNDSMGAYVAERVVKLMLAGGINLLNSRVLILGFTFKENCSDVRNTKVYDIVTSLSGYSITPVVFDPLANRDAACQQYGIEVLDRLPEEEFDAVVLAVAHDIFLQLDIKRMLKPQSVVFDVKSVLPASMCDGRL